MARFALNGEIMVHTLPEVVFHVYPADCDMLGHVNHATMLGFLERARWELLEREEGSSTRHRGTCGVSLLIGFYARI